MNENELDQLYRRIALENHMIYNWGRPAFLATQCEEAIDLVNDGKADELVSNYLADGVEVTAWDFVNHFRLETYINVETV